MKLSINEHNAADIVGLQSKAFGFQLNAKMYDIVINKLYQNKAGAVIRELFANAWDSHVSAGNTETPIEIHMPSWLDQNFGIRDYGTGIPHEDFEDIYCNVGESTKEDSNEFIGAFGLGSKTPFTMTDTYIIENWRDGRKTTWLCFKSNGTPECSKVGDEPSDEPSGLQCSFSFDSKRTVTEFEQELPKQLMFFPVKPKITGDSNSNVKWEEVPEYDSSVDTYFFMENGGYSRYNVKHYVVMGNVSYPFTAEDADISSDYTLRPMFESGNSLVILANLGDVDIPPSREQLELTDKTKAFISKRCNEIMATYVETFVSDMGTQPNLLSARKYVSDANIKMVSAYMNKNHKELTFSDGTTASWSSVQNLWFTDSKYGVYSVVKGYKSALRHLRLDIRDLKKDKYKWYVNDLQIGGASHLNSNRDLLFTTGAVTQYVPIVVKPQSKYSKTTHKRDVLDCVSYITKEYGVVPELLSTVLGTPVVTKKIASKIQADQIFVAKTHRYHTEGLKNFMENYTEDEYPTDGYYMEISGWQVANSNDSSSRFKQQINAFLVRTDKKVYLVRTKSIKKLPKTLKPFSELITEMQEKAREDVINASYIHNVQDTISSAWENRTRLLEFTFAPYKYRLMQRYVRNLMRFPVDIREARRNYELAFGYTYDDTKVVPSKKREVPESLEYLDHWFQHHAADALGIIGQYQYGNKTVRGKEQLKNLINPTQYKSINLI
mgnify:CR=1 FL=1